MHKDDDQDVVTVDRGQLVKHLTNVAKMNDVTKEAIRIYTLGSQLCISFGYMTMKIEATGQFSKVAKVSRKKLQEAIRSYCIKNHLATSNRIATMFIAFDRYFGLKGGYIELSCNSSTLQMEAIEIPCEWEDRREPDVATPAIEPTHQQQRSENSDFQVSSPSSASSIGEPLPLVQLLRMKFSTNNKSREQVHSIEECVAGAERDLERIIDHATELFKPLGISRSQLRRWIDETLNIEIWDERP